MIFYLLGIIQEFCVIINLYNGNLIPNFNEDIEYSRREIDNAISDYWSIHLQSNILLHYWVAPIILTIIMIVLVIYVQKLIMR